MMRALPTWTFVLVLACTPAASRAVSAVFNGDPVNPATGLPYEIVPGSPLLLPGPDGVIGTHDDIIDTSTIGDIDMVVRSGSPGDADTIPPPAAQGGHDALPMGIAGSTAGGGTEVPFTVFLSDGAVSAAAPFGHRLAATDMDGIPVIVAAFADLDGDGFIGPTNTDRSGATDNRVEINELQPIGRAVALFSGGVARGSVAIRAGRPASQGGLTVALSAIALTGPFDPNFFSGSVPSGPAISTALPFVPQRDLTKLIRDRAVPIGPNTTLQPVIDFAVLPSPAGAAPFALPLNGSSPTIDVAVVDSQTAVQAVFSPAARPEPLNQAPRELVLGTEPPASHRRLRLLPLDRWGNPADPSADFAVTLHATPPLQVLRPPRARRGILLPIRSTDGVRVVVNLPANTPDGTSGVLTVERDGVVIGVLPYRVVAGANRPPADIVVPSRAAPTIQSAIEAVSDRNHDGALVVAIRPGLYRENIIVDRPVVLRGDGVDTTIVQGAPEANVVSVEASHCTLDGLTTTGGTNGFALDAAATLLSNVRAWHNVGAGVTVSGDGAQIVRAEAAQNGGDGLTIAGTSGTRCSASQLVDNGRAGASLSAQAPQLDSNLIVGNAGGGINVTSATAANVVENQVGGNLGSGVQLLASQQAQIIGNLCAGNDADGVHIDSKTGEGTAFQFLKDSGSPPSDNLISGNTLDSNHGYGLFVRRSPNDDFSATAGLQAPPGDNSVTNNRKGDVFIRTN